MPLFGKKQAPQAVDVRQVHCPNPECQAVEFMVVRPVHRSEIRDGVVNLLECGQCVVCLACDRPYCIVDTRPGNILKRQPVAMGRRLDVDAKNGAPAPKTQAQMLAELMEKEGEPE